MLKIYAICGLAAALMLVTPLQAEAQRRYFDGNSSSITSVCPATGQRQTASTSWVGYFAEANEPFPRTGDVGYVHAVVGNMGCSNDAAGLEFFLPDGASFAPSMSQRVHCFLGDARGGTTAEVTSGFNVSCLQAPTTGPNGGLYFGYSALPPGWLFEIQVPVVYNNELLGLAGPSGHKLRAAVTSVHGTMWPEQPVTVSYSARFERLATTRVDMHSANVAFDFTSYYKAGQLAVEYWIAGTLAQKTAPVSVPASGLSFPGSTASLTGLAAGTKYHWRVVFSTGNGTFTSGTADFTTAGSGNSWGDPHLQTVNGIGYDFQAAGEFVLLRNSALEVQVRQAPFPTQTPVPADSHTGLSVCAAINTAIAMRVGERRVSYQANPERGGDPSALELKVGGKRTKLAPISLGEHGKITPTAAPGGLRVDTAEGSAIIITPGWSEGAKLWYFHIDIQNVLAPVGLIGTIDSSSWLPALPDGSMVGRRPVDTRLRYGELYGRFADAWRVSADASLFDYFPGTSTTTFTDRQWPLATPRTCANLRIAAEAPPGVGLEVAQGACRALIGERARTNCVQDVMTTGETDFALSYELSERAARTSTK